MEGTTIVLIVIFAICGLVLLWALKNGNNIKLKKKDKKAKKSNEDKFKDVVPKEKKKKQHKQKISETAKAEKAGTKEPPTNKIMKVTKEDFKSNDIEIPKSLETPVSKESKVGSPIKLKDEDLKGIKLKSSNESNDFGFAGNLDKFNLPDLKDFSNEEDDFWKDMPDDFILPPLAKEHKERFGKNDDIEKDFADFNKGMEDNSGFWKGLEEIQNPQPNKEREKGEILNEIIEARFEKVFGKTSEAPSVAKEIIIGDVLSGNRSRTNRELREKRLKRVISPMPMDDNPPKE